MLRKWLARFRKEERGQDLIEYSLLIGFLALAVAGVFVGTGNSITGIWTSASTTIAVANGADPSSAATAPATGGNGGGNHGDHGDGDHDWR